MFGTKTTHVLKRSLTLLSTGLALGVFATATSAGTFTVDATVGATADFMEIQEALDSPLVQDGDVLLVQPGEYLKVKTTKSVTIRGMGIRPSDVVVLKGPLTYPASSYFEDATGDLVLTNLTFEGGLYLARCTGVSVVQEVHLQYIRAIQMSQLRIESVSPPPVPGFFGTSSLWGIVEDNSWVSAVDTNFISLGSATGLDVSGGSYVRLANCNLAGGVGSNGIEWLLQSGDPGGPGLLVTEQSTVHLIGQSGNSAVGGDGGWGWEAAYDGSGAPGIIATTGSTVRISNYTLTGGFDPTGWIQAPGYGGGALWQITGVLHDPLLGATGSFAVGAQAVFQVQAPGSTPVALFAGPGAISTPLPGIIGMLAVNYQVLLNVGATDASGQYVHGFTMPAGIPAGLIATVQAGLFYAGDGSTRLSNPVTVLVP